MSLKLEGKVAIVTGASKGIGAAIAKNLAAKGAAVVVNYANDEKGANKAVSEITADGGRAVAVKGNVGNATDVENLFKEALNAFGRVDILVNNAGIYEFSPLEGITREHYDNQFNTNVWGVILASQQAVKHFPETGGSIINISSVVSTKGFSDSAVYSATKGALDTIGLALATELAPRNIRVNTVAPGPVDTEGFASAGIKGSDLEENMVAVTPLGRLGQPDDIARVVTFLASDDAGWLTGERITAAGGVR